MTQDPDAQRLGERIVQALDGAAEWLATHRPFSWINQALSVADDRTTS